MWWNANLSNGGSVDEAWVKTGQWIISGWKAKMKLTSEWACRDAGPRVQSDGKCKEHLKANKRFDKMHWRDLHLPLASALHAESKSCFTYTVLKVLRMHCIFTSTVTLMHLHHKVIRQMSGVISLTREKKEFTPLIFLCLQKGDNPPTEWQPSYEMQMRSMGLIEQRKAEGPFVNEVHLLHQNCCVA